MRWSKWLLVIPAVLLLVASAGPALAARGGDPVRPGKVIPYVIVHYEHNGKDHPGGGPPGGGGGGGGTDDHSTHYVLLPGPRADSSVTYVVEDPGLDGAVEAVQASFAAWDAVSGITFNFGGTASVNANTEVGGANGANTVSWALLVGGWTNALAVTILWINDADGDNVWDSGEAIVEADLLFNSKYNWATDDTAADAKGKWFDVQNVGTHEAGHFVGLDDQCQWDDETMYCTAGPKETKKRSLEPGDIAGAQVLYPLP